jgi:acetate kinase
MKSPLRVLCVNCGSSTTKLAVFALGPTEIRLAAESTEVGESALRDGLARLERRRALEVGAVAHRFVHGGPDRFDPAVVSDDLVRELEAAVPFAPLHLPLALDALRTARARLPGVPHVVCFDTAFHRTLPELARRLPLPEALHARGVRRYGFHGLSYEYVVGALGADARGRLVIAHLGNGASLAAVLDGVSVDTTMGMTPAGGVVMGTRTGDLDPGVLVHLLRSGYDVDALERTLLRESGLLALSETTSDVKTLLAARDRDPRAARALDAFVRSVTKGVAAMVVSLGGLDRLVFTGGIGEHAAELRAQIVAGLAFLGPLDVRVVPTDEDLVMARHARRLCST